MRGLSAIKLRMYYTTGGELRVAFAIKFYLAPRVDVTLVQGNG